MMTGLSKGTDREKGEKKEGQMREVEWTGVRLCDEARR
jgi:hypothetical protein